MKNKSISKSISRMLSYSLGLSLLLVVASCDFILKSKDVQDDKGTIYTSGGKAIAGEEDEHGCTYTAGYRWSDLNRDCIRVFEIGFRLNPIALEEGNSEENELEDNDVSCFVIFNHEDNKAEIFLPNKLKSIVLENKNIQGLYSNDGWELDTRKKMTLKKKDVLVFTAAKAIEIKIINPDQIIEEDVE